MSDDIIKSLFLKCQASYESANRWSFIIILALLLFHLLTFSQFVALRKQSDAAQAEHARLSGLEKTVVEVKSGLENLKETLLAPLRGRMDALLEDLRGDFETLDRSVAMIRTRATETFTKSSADRLLEEESSRPMMQMQIPLTRRPKRTFDLSDQLKQEIKAAPDEDSLRKVLAPFIGENIIEKRFEELTRFWQEDVLARIKKQIQTIEKKIGGAESQFPQGRSAWEEIEASLTKVDQVASAITFSPPQDPRWWISMSEKMASLSSIQDTVQRKLMEAIDRSRAIDDLRAQVSKALAQQKELQSLLQAKMKQLEEDFEKQQAKLSSLNKSFGIVPLDLNFLVPLFPLILGVILAAITFWPAYRLAELITISDLMAQEDPETVTWKWLRHRVGLSILQAHGEGSEEQIQKELRSPKRNLLLGAWLRCLLCWIWIAIAAVQLIDWPETDDLQLTLYAFAAFFLTALAQGYRWRIGRMALGGAVVGVWRGMGSSLLLIHLDCWH